MRLRLFRQRDGWHEKALDPPVVVDVHQMVT